jgi:hypothetical protein
VPGPDRDRLAADYERLRDAQHDLIRRTHPPAVLTGDDAASLARDYPQLVASLGLDDTVLAELVSGERDVFTAACADQLSGLHGPKGRPCPARVWVCLLCPLAVFAPRHAASLLRLKAFFSHARAVDLIHEIHAGVGRYAAAAVSLLLDAVDRPQDLNVVPPSRHRLFLHSASCCSASSTPGRSGIR